MIKNLLSLLWLLLLPIITLATSVQVPVVNQQSVFFNQKANQPTSIATAPDGRLFVLDGMNSHIMVFSDQGESILTIRPNKKIPNFYQAIGITWANDTLYIADTKHHRLLVLSDIGKFIKTIPLPITIPEKHSPEPVAVTIIDSQLIYSDRQHHRLCFIDLDDTSKRQKCTGQRGSADGKFQFPFQVAIDDSHYLHVIDVINARVQIINQQGQFFSQYGRFAVDELYRPNGIAIDPLRYSYISDAYLGTIAVYHQGQYLGKLKDEAGHILKFKAPAGLWYDSKGLYVTETGNNQVVLLQLGYQQQAIEQPASQSNEAISQKNCINCHFSWGFTDKLALQDEQGVQPVASVDMCYSCHRGIVFESRHAIPHGQQHPTLYDSDKEKQARKNKQPRKEEGITEAHPLLKDGEMLCTTCHTPHNPEEEQPTLYEENTNSWMRWINKDANLCEDCHESQTKTARERHKKRKGINHPLGFKLSKSSKKHPDHSQDPHLQKGLPRSLVKGGAMLGSEQQMTCQSCHQIHAGQDEDLLAVTQKKGLLCAKCHQRQSPKGKKQAHKRGVHPVNIKLEEPVTFRGKKTYRVNCQSCHSIHEGTQGTALYPDKIKRTEKLCEACHERHHAKDKEDALKKGVHLMNEKLEDPVKIAGNKVQKMGCLSCHSIHNGKPNTAVLLESDHNAQLCENCHQDKQRIVGTDHDFRVTAKKSQNQHEQNPHQSGVCGTCHTMHKGQAKQPYLSAIILKQQQTRDDSAPKLAVDELCLNCHQEKGIGKDKPIEYYGHPYKDIILRSDENIMPLLNQQTEKAEKIGVIACITCHDPHRWQPKTANESTTYQVLNHRTQKNKEGNILDSFLIRKGVIKTFCIECHGIEALSKYKYYHHKDKVRDIGVDYLK